MRSGVLLCVLIKRYAVTEWSRTKHLMFCQLEWRWEMQECCTIHHLGAFIKEKIHWCSRERERERATERPRNTASESVCVM